MITGFSISVSGSDVCFGTFFTHASVGWVHVVSHGMSLVSTRFSF